VDTILYMMYVFIYLIMLGHLSVIIHRKIKRYKFNSFIVFSLSYILFYIFVPVVHFFFPNIVNTSTHYNILISQSSPEKTFFTTLFLYSIFMLLNVLYNSLMTNTNQRVKPYLFIAKKPSRKKIYWITTILFSISFFSIVYIVFAVGGLTNYFALGAYTRGHVSGSDEVISSSLLPLITLSVLSLFPPYMYYLFMKRDNRISIKFFFSISFIVAIFYLIHSQGRAPLILFLLPFVLVTLFKKKIKISYLIVLLLIIFPLLELLNSYFNYLSYGVFDYSSSNLIEQFSREFSYPFSNFLYRDQLLNRFGYRFFIDYIIWIPRLIPQQILNIIGFGKSSIETIRFLNTEAYSSILSLPAGGGIPVDLLTYTYYQMGYISVFLSLSFVVYLISKLDKIIIKMSKFKEYQILFFRVIFSIPILMTNSDLSAVTKSRIDIIIMIIIIVVINKKLSHYELVGVNEYEKNKG